jgi:hypothetical protein
MEKPNYSTKDFIFTLLCFGSFPFTAFVNNYIFNILGIQVTVFEMLHLMDEADNQMEIAIFFLTAVIIYAIILTYIFYGKRGLWFSIRPSLIRIIKKLNEKI